jgi:hypothetical protein
MIPELFASAVELQARLTKHGFRFCFIGGLAVQRWGEPRSTQDVDVTLLTGFGDEAPFVDALLAELTPRIPDARSFALRHRVLLLRDARGIPIDVALGAMPFEERCVARGSDYDVGDATIFTCSATDLVVMKAFASREQDWVDIRGVLVRSRDAVDIGAVRAELEPLVLLKEEPEILERLDRLWGATNA